MGSYRVLRHALRELDSCWRIHVAACVAHFSPSLSVVRVTSYLYCKSLVKSTRIKGIFSWRDHLLSLTYVAPFCHTAPWCFPHACLNFVLVAHRSIKCQNNTRELGLEDPCNAPAWEPWSVSLGKIKVSIFEGGNRWGFGCMMGLRSSKFCSKLISYSWLLNSISGFKLQLRQKGLVVNLVCCPVEKLKSASH